MWNLAIRRVVAGSGLVLACSGQSPLPGWTPQPHYVAMCSWLEGPGAAEYRKRAIADLGSVPDDSSVSSSASALFPGAHVDVLVRRSRKDRVDGAEVEREHATIRVREGGAPARYVDVTVGRDGTVHDPKPAENPKPSRPYPFARAMVTYIYFNQLMADDTTMHRESCSETMRYQISGLPLLIREAAAAFAVEPPPDAPLLERVRAAYGTLVAATPALSGAERDLTRETVARLGRLPPITIVFRDRDAETGSENDVVRIGTPSIHTYAMFSSDAAAGGKLAPTPLCLTGDRRCGAYYSWP
jgi:hypothetical protein